MFEKVNPKNQVLKAGVIGTCAVAGGIGFVSAMTAGASKSRADAKPSAVELKVGGTIKGTKFEEFDANQKSRQVTLTPDKSGVLGIIYSPEVSRDLLLMVNDKNPDHAIGFLLTEKSDKVRISLIFFLRRSGVIAHIGNPSEPIKNTEQPLFRGSNNTSTDEYIVEIDPSGKPNGAVSLDYINVASPNQTTTLPAIAA